MTRLISKVQYKNFEAGEFVEVCERTFNETTELIEKFPWTDQRDKIVIDLTNPSITIEGKNNDFLKLHCSLIKNMSFTILMKHQLCTPRVLLTWQMDMNT